jgi:hypothetical protein
MTTRNFFTSSKAVNQLVKIKGITFETTSKGIEFSVAGEVNEINNVLIQLEMSGIKYTEIAAKPAPAVIINRTSGKRIVNRDLTLFGHPTHKLNGCIDEAIIDGQNTTLADVARFVAKVHKRTAVSVLGRCRDHIRYLRQGGCRNSHHFDKAVELASGVDISKAGAKL